MSQGTTGQSGSAFGQHIPSSQDTSPTVMSEGVAKIVFLLVGIVFGPFLLYQAVTNLVGMGIKVVAVLVALYVIGAVAQFWLRNVWKGGMTQAELMDQVIFWPKGFLASVAEGTEAMKGHFTPRTKVAQPGDEFMPAWMALGFGGIFTVAAGYLVMWVFGSFVGLTFGLVWLGFLAYLIGFGAYVVKARAWVDGVTVNELMQAAAWPIPVVARLRASAKAHWARRQAGGMAA